MRVTDLYRVERIKNSYSMRMFIHGKFLYTM